MYFFTEIIRSCTSQENQQMFSRSVCSFEIRRGSNASLSFNLPESNWPKDTNRGVLSEECRAHLHTTWLQTRARQKMCGVDEWPLAACIKSVSCRQHCAEGGVKLRKLLGQSVRCPAVSVRVYGVTGGVIWRRSSPHRLRHARGNL